MDGDELVDDSSAAEKVEFRLGGTCTDCREGEETDESGRREERKFWSENGELRYEPAGTERG